jgi:hypothetical protein
MVGPVTGQRANRILIAEEQVARQRAIVRRLEAQHADTADAKSLRRHSLRREDRRPVGAARGAVRPALRCMPKAAARAAP